MTHRRPLALASLFGFLAGILATSIFLWMFGDDLGITLGDSLQQDRGSAITERWPLRESAQRNGDAVLTKPPVPGNRSQPPKKQAQPRPEPVLSASEHQMIQELRKRNLLLPVQGVQRELLRTSFHEARGDRVHEAIDILAPRNTPVVAVENGTIAKLYYSDRGGITLYQFDPEKNYVYYYAHLERYAGGLKEGDRLNRGQIIGYVGTSGNAPKDTPHLHFAIVRMNEDKHWWEGNPIDPYQVLQ